jgi:pentatricopeptide repeat protein
MHVVAPALQQLDSSALAALLKELGRQGARGGGGGGGGGGGLESPFQGSAARGGAAGGADCNEARRAQACRVRCRAPHAPTPPNKSPPRSPAGLATRAVEVFDHLRGDGGAETTHLLDIYTYTTAISVCSSSQQLERALELAAEMRSRGISCNVHTYRSVCGGAPGILAARGPAPPPQRGRQPRPCHLRLPGADRPLFLLPARSTPPVRS